MTTIDDIQDAITNAKAHTTFMTAAAGTENINSAGQNIRTLADLKQDALDNAVSLLKSGPFARLHTHAAGLPPGRNYIGPLIFNRGDGRVTLIVKRSASHYADNEASIWGYDSRDNGLTFENARQIHNLPGPYAADLCIGENCGGRGVLLATSRTDTGSRIDYGAPLLIKADDIDTGDWAATPLTLDASLPPAFNCLFVGRIYRWPASEGGHDVTGWIAFCYSQNSIGMVTTTDNWTTANPITLAVATFGPGAGRPMTEMGVVGTSASGYTMILRLNGYSRLWLSFSSSINGPWSQPIQSLLPGDDSPPSTITVSDTEAYVFLRSSKNVQSDPHLQGTLTVRRLDPVTLYASGGSSGYGDDLPIATLGSWGAGYTYPIKRNDGWMFATSGGERPIWPNTTHGGSSDVIIGSNTPVPTIGASVVHGRFLRADDNALPNGELLYWTRTAGTPSGYETAAECWRVGRAGGSATSGHFWERAEGRDGPYALRFGRIQGSSDTADINCLTAIHEHDFAHIRGQLVSVGLDLTAGETLSGPVYIYVECSDAFGRIQTSDGTYAGNIDLLEVNNPTLTPTSPRQAFGSFFLPKSAKMLSIRVVIRPAGTAGPDDWVEIENAFVVPGCYAPASPLARSLAEVKARCERYRYQTWSGVSPATAFSRFTKVASATTEYFHINHQMHTTPIGTVYSNDSGTPGFAYNGTGGVDIGPATVVLEGPEGASVQVLNCTVGQSVNAHAELDGQMW